MQTYSTREAAKKLGITGVALGRYLKLGKVPLPANAAKAGTRTIQLWTDAEIERVRKLLPKIANGRKTRYQKKQSAVGNQQSAGTKHSAFSIQQSAKTKDKAPARVPVPHKKKRSKKK